MVFYYSEINVFVSLLLVASYTVLQSKRANFVVFKVFCYIHKSIQEGSILSLWEGTTSTCSALWEVTCCHVTQVCHYGFI